MAESEVSEPFFAVEGDRLVPSGWARGPWSPHMLHGRLLGGLLARAVERGHAAEGFHYARLTVDLYRNSPLVPLRVRTERVRDGRRIRVVDAFVESENGPVARASAVMLRRGEQPEGTVWQATPWNVPGPDELGPPSERSRASLSTFDLWRIAADGSAGGDFASGERHRAWIRETRPLVAGEPVSPLVRIALAADMASPLAHFGSAGLKFINADYTMTLSRLPLGEAIGAESTGHLSDEGVAVGQCTLYDTAGPLGFCATTAIANVMPPR
jgi:hypothetical protein